MAVGSRLQFAIQKMSLAIEDSTSTTDWPPHERCAKRCANFTYSETLAKEINLFENQFIERTTFHAIY
jgi:hypothetical protein